MRPGISNSEGDVSKDLKEKIMLQIYDPFEPENWASDSCVCLYLRNFSVMYTVVHPTF